MIQKQYLLALLALLCARAAQGVPLQEVQCPPFSDADLPALPGQCTTSYLCVGEGGNISVKSSGAEAGSNCESVAIALRCSGAHETVVYDNLGGNPDVKCDYAIIDFTTDGRIQQKCCWTSDVTPPNNEDDGNQQPLTDGDEQNEPNNGTDEQPQEEDGTTDQNEGEPNDNNNGTEGEPSTNCPGKDNNIPVVLDEQDPNYVWACRCNEGEVPERQLIAGSKDDSGCPIIDLAIQKIENVDYTIFCGRGFSAESTRIQTIYNGTVRECITQCSRDESCAAIWFDIRNCVLLSDLSAVPQPYLVPETRTNLRSVVAIKGNVTELAATPTVIEEPEPNPADNVVLANPTPIVGDIAGSPLNADDEYYQLELPFPIHIYDRSSTTVFLMVNGVISLDSGSHSFARVALPTTNLPPYSVLGLWTDLYIYQGTPQGIYYEVAGEVGARTITFEWYCSQFHQPTQYYHFTMAFYEGSPGAVKVKYYDVLDSGSQATVGVQGNDQFVQFSLNQDVIVPGLEINFDSHKGNRFTQTTFQR